MKLAVRPVIGNLGAAEVAILVATGIGAVGVTWFPSDLAVSAGAGTELAFALDLLAMGVAVAAALAVVRRHPGRRYTALLAELVGHRAAAAAAVAVALLDVALAGFVVGASGVTISANFLPLTPLWAVELLFLLPASYSAALGLEALARAFDLVTPIVVVLLVATSVLAVSEAQYAAAAVPHVPAVGGWAAIFGGAYAGVWSIGGITLVPNICAQIAPRQAPRLVSRVAAGAGLAAFGALGLLVVDLAVMGVVGLSWYQWPTVSALRQTRTEAFLFNRVGGLDEWILVLMVCSFVTLHLWNAVVNVTDVLAPRARHERSRRGPATPVRNGILGVLGSAAVYGVARALGGGGVFHLFTDTYLDPAVVVLGLGLPVVLCGIDRVRRGARPTPAGSTRPRPARGARPVPEA